MTELVSDHQQLVVDLPPTRALSPTRRHFCALCSRLRQADRDGLLSARHASALASTPATQCASLLASKCAFHALARGLAVPTTTRAPSGGRCSSGFSRALACRSHSSVSLCSVRPATCNFEPTTSSHAGRAVTGKGRRRRRPYTRILTNASQVSLSPAGRARFVMRFLRLVT